MTLPTPKPGTGLMTIAFDLDGTLAEATWPSPDIGTPIAKGVDALLAYHDQGYEIIIWTARPATHLKAITTWLAIHGLLRSVYNIVTDKPRAAMYVDDRAVTFPEAFTDPLLVELDRRFGEAHRRRCVLSGCANCAGIC